MAQLTVPITIDHDDLQRIVDERITELKSQFIPKAEYEARLKADLEAILVDLQLDVEGQKFDTHMDKDVWNDAIRVCSELIQQKINELGK